MKGRRFGGFSIPVDDLGCLTGLGPIVPTGLPFPLLPPPKEGDVGREQVATKWRHKDQTNPNRPTDLGFLSPGIGWRHSITIYYTLLPLLYAQTHAKLLRLHAYSYILLLPLPHICPILIRSKTEPSSDIPVYFLIRDEYLDCGRGFASCGHLNIFYMHIGSG